MTLYTLTRTITRSYSLKQSAISVVGSILASILAAIVLIMLSRLLGPSFFGQFSAAFALLLILVKINDLGLGVATTKLVSNHDQLSQKIALSVITRYRLILSVLIAIAGLILSRWYCLTSNSSSCFLFVLAFWLTFATAFFEHAQLSLQAKHQFTLAALLNTLQGLLKPLLILPIVLWSLSIGITPDVLVILSFIFYLLAPFLPVALLLLIKPVILNWSFMQMKNHDLHDQIKLIKSQTLSICKQAGIGVVLGAMIENLDILLVQNILSDRDAGLLAGAFRIAMLLTVIAAAVSGVLNPIVTRFQSPAQLKHYWQKSWLIVAGCILGFVATIFLAKPILLLSLGPAYLEALPLLHYLLAAGFISIALTPFIAFFYTTNNQSYFTWSALGQLLLIFIGNLVLLPALGVSGAAITRLICKIILFTVTVWSVRHQVAKNSIVENKDKMR